MASSSSSSSHVVHHIFPSFHGPDVRNVFIGHLHTVFASKNITMFDDRNMEKGQTIGPELIRAIRNAKASIVVLSKNYASSICCLDELLEILRCKEASGQIVMPVFYDVDPSDVKKQKGEFGVAFQETCDGVTEEKKQRWIEALICVANIFGVHSSKCADDATMLENISTAMLPQLKVAKLKEAFKICDVDNDGFITEPELRYVMTKYERNVTEKEVRKIIKASDVNGDARVSYDEFVKYLEKTYLGKRWWERLLQKPRCHEKKRELLRNILRL